MWCYILATLNWYFSIFTNWSNRRKLIVPGDDRANKITGKCNIFKEQWLSFLNLIFIICKMRFDTIVSKSYYILLFQDLVFVSLTSSHIPILDVQESQLNKEAHSSAKIIQLNFNMSNLLTDLSILSCELLKNMINRLLEG